MLIYCKVILFILTAFIIVAVWGILGRSRPTPSRAEHGSVSCFYLKCFSVYHSKRKYPLLYQLTQTLIANSIPALFNLKSCPAAGQCSVVDAHALYLPVVTLTSSGKPPAWGMHLGPSAATWPHCLSLQWQLWPGMSLLLSLFPSKDVLQCFPICLPPFLWL